MYTLQCYLSDGIFFETKQVDVMNPLAYFVSLRIYSTHIHTHVARQWAVKTAKFNSC